MQNLLNVYLPSYRIVVNICLFVNNKLAVYSRTNENNRVYEQKNNISAEKVRGLDMHCLRSHCVFRAACVCVCVCVFVCLWLRPLVSINTVRLEALHVYACM